MSDASLARGWFDATAFTVGFAVMAAEMSAGRLMAPYYGTSTPVWALLIGAVMLSLAVGQLVGGRLSRRAGRSPQVLFALLLLAGLVLALLPAVARPLMQGSLQLFRQGGIGTLAASALAVLALFGLPLVALGGAGPLLIHHALATGAGADDGRPAPQAGPVAGRIYALGTAGSLLGTYLPGLFLVPALGSGRTLWLCAGLLAGLGGAGLLRGRRRGLAVIAPLVAALVPAVVAPGPIKQRPHAVHEQESAHNYLQVTDDGRERRLYLNDGYAVQSILRADGSLSLHGIWGHYAQAPAWTTGGRPRDVLLLGLGGGTAARSYHTLFPEARVTAVELDPAVVDAARRFLALPPQTRVVVDDARAFVHRDTATHDVIILDAFRFPYVPFQLATAEFFAELGARLAPGGVLLVNAGRDGDAHDVVDALAATLAVVFPHVRGVDVGGSNTILVASRHAPEQEAGLQGLALPEEVRRRLAGLSPLRPWRPASDAPVLTDERSPVELLTDRILLRRLLAAVTGGPGAPVADR